MSAHSRPLELVCYQNGCRKQATEEVFNTYNASQGKFCKAHAAQRVAALTEPPPPQEEPR